MNEEMMMNSRFDEVLKHAESEQALLDAFRQTLMVNVKDTHIPPQESFELFMECLSLAISHFSRYLYATWVTLYLEPAPNTWGDAPSQAFDPSDDDKHFYQYLVFALHHLEWSWNPNEHTEALYKRMMTGTRLLNLVLGNFFPCENAATFHAQLNQCIQAIYHHDTELAAKAGQALSDSATALSQKLMLAESEYNRKVADFKRENPNRTIGSEISRLQLPFGNFFELCGGKAQEIGNTAERRRVGELEAKRCFTQLYQAVRGDKINSLREIANYALTREGASDNMRLFGKTVMDWLDDPVRMDDIKSHPEPMPGDRSADLTPAEDTERKGKHIISWKHAEKEFKVSHSQLGKWLQHQKTGGKKGYKPPAQFPETGLDTPLDPFDIAAQRYRGENG